MKAFWDAGIVCVLVVAGSFLLVFYAFIGAIWSWLKNRGLKNNPNVEEYNP